MGPFVQSNLNVLLTLFRFLRFDLLESLSDLLVFLDHAKERPGRNDILIGQRQPTRLPGCLADALFVSRGQFLRHIAIETRLHGRQTQFQALIQHQRIKVAGIIPPLAQLLQ
jgi:hypothetical protein